MFGNVAWDPHIDPVQVKDDLAVPLPKLNLESESQPGVIRKSTSESQHQPRVLEFERKSGPLDAPTRGLNPKP